MSREKKQENRVDAVEWMAFGFGSEESLGLCGNSFGNVAEK